MSRDDYVIIYSTDEDTLCKACIGREIADNLCYVLKNKDKCIHISFTCIVSGYGKEATSINEHGYFDNTIHKLLLSTKQCFLCGMQCNFDGSMCDEVYDTICMYKKVKGLDV